MNPIKDWKNSPIKGESPSFNNWVSAGLMLLEIQSVRDDPFSKVISRHFDLVDALGKFRDKAGPVSHGKEGFAKKLSAHHRRAAVLAADALVTFLHEAYLERENPIQSLRLSLTNVSPTRMPSSIFTSRLRLPAVRMGGWM